MATVIEKVSKLKLVTMEVTEDGKKTRSKTFGNIDSQASDDALHTAATQVISLLAQAPDEIRRVDELTLN